LAETVVWLALFGVGEYASCIKLPVTHDGHEKHEVEAGDGAYDPAEHGVQLSVAAVALDAVPI